MPQFPYFGFAVPHLLWGLLLNSHETTSTRVERLGSSSPTPIHWAIEPLVYPLQSTDFVVADPLVLSPFDERGMNNSKPFGFICLRGT